MIYNFMRLILFFDLPVVSDKDKRIYATFRKYLIRNGYIMLQYSVYSKIFANRDSAVNHIGVLKNNLPKKGAVRTMLVTEKQYSKMEVLVGQRSKLEEKITTESFMIF